MIHVIKIALFAIVNALGFYALPTLANVAIMLDVYPQFSTATDLNTFNNLFYGIGMWVWVAAAVVSIGYFFVKTAELRMMLILSPLFLPIIYGIGLITYCEFSNSL